MNGQNANVYRVTEENLIPTVKKYFDTLSTAQWDMIAEGNLNKEIQAVLAGMITEIIQTVSGDLLKIFLPMIQEYITATAPLRTVQAELGDSLSKSFATFLNVTEDTYPDAQELTKMVEKEIGDNVNSHLTRVTFCKAACAPKPAINMQQLCRMVVNTGRCLKAYLGKINLKCRGVGQGKNIIKLQLLVEKVSKILLKWTKEMPKIKENGKRVFVPVTPLTTLTQRTATKIVNILKRTIKTDQTSESSSNPFLKRELIIDELKKFFASHCVLSQSCEYAMKDLKHLFSNLEGVFVKKDNELITLKSNIPQPVDHVILYVPDTPEQYALLQQEVNDEYSFSYKNIILDIGNFFKTFIESNQTEVQNLGKINSCKKFQMFLNELVEKLHIYLTAQSERKVFSDSAIKIERTEDENEATISSKLLHSIIKDRVEELLKVGLLHLQKSTDETIYSKEVHAALKDIEVILKNVIKSPGEDTGKSDLPVLVHLDCGSHLGDAENVSIQGEDPVSPNLHSGDVAEAVSKESQKGECDDETQNMTVSSLENTPPTDDGPSCSPRNDKRQKNTCFSVDDGSLPERYSLTTSLVAALVLRLVPKYTWERKKSVEKEELHAIYEHLSTLVFPEMDMDGSMGIVNQKNIKDLAKTLIKHLLRRYNTPTDILLAAMATDDSSFDDALITCLKYELLKRKHPPKKNPVSRFFSSIGKCFSFSFCFSLCCFKN